MRVNSGIEFDSHLVGGVWFDHSWRLRFEGIQNGTLSPSARVININILSRRGSNVDSEVDRVRNEQSSTCDLHTTGGRSEGS